MFSNVMPTEIKATGITDSSVMNGVDLMTSVQMLLVQEYDDQLKGMASQIKMTTKVKKAYREVIEKMTNMLCRETKKIKFDGKNEKDAVTLNSDEKEYLQDDKEFVGDVETGEVEDVCKTKTTDFESQKVKGTSHTHVSKEVIEKKIEIYKQKLDSLNEQTELMSVSLQSLTNQRKICFETISNIVKKQEDCVGTIVRNIG